MNSYSFSNIKITNEHISADVCVNQNYMMRVTDDILYIKPIFLQHSTILIKNWSNILGPNRSRILVNEE